MSVWHYVKIDILYRYIKDTISFPTAVWICTSPASSVCQADPGRVTRAGTTDLKSWPHVEANRHHTPACCIFLFPLVLVVVTVFFFCMWLKGKTQLAESSQHAECREGRGLWEMKCRHTQGRPWDREWCWHTSQTGFRGQGQSSHRSL